MKTPLLTAAALAFTAAVNLSPASAAEIRGFSGEAWSNLAQATGSASPDTAAQAPRYEWQYHYARRRPRWEGHWVLVR